MLGIINTSNHIKITGFEKLFPILRTKSLFFKFFYFKPQFPNYEKLRVTNYLIIISKSIISIISYFSVKKYEIIPSEVHFN